MLTGTPPTKEEIGSAINRGEKLYKGLPLIVRRDDIGERWQLNLAAVDRKEPDPWVATRRVGQVIEIATDRARTLAVGGMKVSGQDVAACDAALKLSPVVGSRHDPESNARRLQAGKMALRITDNMVRARMLDAVDGWEAIRESGIVMDEDKEHGILVKPDERLGLQCNLLVVVCPSTARRYALRVPSEMRTAKEARLWTLGDDWNKSPEVET